MDIARLKADISPPCIDLQKCIFCQTSSSEFLSSGDKGRNELLNAAKIMHDDYRSNLINNVSESDFASIKYHSVSCYSTYMKAYKRYHQSSSKNTGPVLSSNSNDSLSEVRSSKRLKLSNNICVVCGSYRSWNSSSQSYNYVLHRISENDRAQKLLNAAHLCMDEVFTRLSTYYEGGVGAIFAHDVLCHKKCINKYLVEYDRKIDSIMTNLQKENVSSNETKQVFLEFISSLDLEHNGYSLSYVRDEVNKLLGYNIMSNRSVKSLLLEKFNDQIYFTYPENKRISQMFFSINIKNGDLVDYLRKSKLKETAMVLKSEVLNYDFGISSSFRDPNDLNLAMNQFKQNRPPKWMEFMEYFFSGRKVSSENPSLMLKLDALFQMIYFISHNGSHPTPLHVNLSETVHNLSRSKTLITIMNECGMCCSYTEMKKIDTQLAKRIISRVGSSRVPVAPVFKQNQPICGSMDNFDHLENTLSGIGSSHDTVLVLFQNIPKSQELHGNMLSISQKSDVFDKDIKLKNILPCQKLIRMERKQARASIPNDYSVCENFLSSSFPEKVKMNYFLWTICRYQSRKDNEDGQYYIPGFTGVQSIFMENIFHPTTSVFVPILPYKATEYDSVFTTMINFQDVLKQEDKPYGGLWCDEGVYKLAKEIQLLKPDQFDNIFLGLGGFHFEKIVYGCIGAYLKPSGISSILVETECFGPEIVNSVMEGSHYIRSKEGLSCINEAITCLMIEDFLEECDNEISLTDIVNSVVSHKYENWEICADFLSVFQNDFDKFCDERCKRSENFYYWHFFCTSIFPIARNLTLSLRSGDWNGYITSIRNCLPLFFAFGKTHYSRWAPLFYQDCLTIEKKYPLLYESFKMGGFVVHRKRKGSGTPMDQALEQMYNKPSKGTGGIIGITRRKEAVALWDLIKHEKDQYTSNMHYETETEHSLHHEFNQSCAISSSENVRLIIEYIKKVCNPLSEQLNTKPVRNIATGQESQAEFSYSMSCIINGEKLYTEYVELRLKTKKVHLFDTLKRNKLTKNVSPPKTVFDPKNETILAMKYIDYAKFRGYDISEILKYEITPTSFYLSDSEGYLKKPTKYLLGKELFSKFSIKPSNEILPSDYMFIDFMAYARKITVKKIVDSGGQLSTFGDMFIILSQTFLSLGGNASEIHLIFDLYRETSIKGSERKRRAKSDQITISISSYSQKLPVELKKYWASSENKVQFQQNFIKWFINHNDCTRPVYLGGSIENKPYSCLCVIKNEVREIYALTASHEEADDRLMFHINYVLQHTSRKSTITVVSSDTDILVCLIYHAVRWINCNNLSFLWMVKGSYTSREVIPIHMLVDNIPPEVTQILPAVHALTGCDSVSKISTKSSAIKCASYYSNLLYAFGKEPLTDEIIEKAERFLVNCLKPQSSNDESFDELRVRIYCDTKSKADFTNIPCTSSAIKLHISRAYFQCRLWMEAPFHDISSILDPTQYGYLKNDEDLEPIIVKNPVKPADLPPPCKCVKCAKANVCPCRRARLACCIYCKCSNSDDCKNPENII